MKTIWGEKTLCEFCANMPLVGRAVDGYVKKWEEKEAKELAAKLETNPGYKPEPVIGVVAQQKKGMDESAKTGITVMALCAFFGLLAGGFGGALLGAALGFGGTAIVLAAKEGTRDL